MQIHLCPVSPAYSVRLWLAVALLDRQLRGALGSQDFDIGVSASQHFLSQPVSILDAGPTILQELVPGQNLAVCTDVVGAVYLSQWRFFFCHRIIT